MWHAWSPDHCFQENFVLLNSQASKPDCLSQSFVFFLCLGGNRSLPKRYDMLRRADHEVASVRRPLQNLVASQTYYWSCAHWILQHTIINMYIRAAQYYTCATVYQTCLFITRNRKPVIWKPVPLRNGPGGLFIVLNTVPPGPLFMLNTVHPDHL